MMEPAYRVLVADDHPMAREAIKSLLAGDPSFSLIGEATNGEEAVQLSGQLQPDLVLMDIQMPVIGGLEATKTIKRLYPHIQVVILTVSDDVADLFTALQFGAQGYLLKNMNPDEWINYLHALLEGNSDVYRKMADRLFFQFRHDHPKPPDLGVLTTREAEILAHVAAGDTNRQIAEKLNITENTVKNHIKNILEKLEMENRVQLTAYAIRNGLSQYDQQSE